MRRSELDVAVLGGSVGGLAAAHWLVSLDCVQHVEIFERQEYRNKRVQCGEAINDATLVPLQKTPENGFVNDIDGYELRVFREPSRRNETEPLTTARFDCPAGYICERDKLERRWAEAIAARGVKLQTGENISPSQYDSLVESYDIVVDATGHPALSLKARETTTSYSGQMVALNARVEGDFETSVRWPRLFFEGYLGYSWFFPQSDDQANVGIGWAGDDRPDDYFAALRDTAVRNGFPVPKSDRVSVDTIPRGPGLSPDRVQFPEDGVYLVGDAAGTANRYQGEGICQAIRSARLFCDCLSAGLPERYAEKLFSRMRPEYVLAELIRGVWEEHQSLPLLADVVRALDGATIADITRSPSRVAARLFRRPSTVAKLFANRSMLRRTVRCLGRNWDFPH